MINNLTDGMAKQIIPSSELSDPLSCPRCKGTTLEIYGTWRREFRDVLNSGIVVDTELGDEMMQDVEQVVCGRCGVVFVISDDESYQREMELVGLRLQVGSADKKKVV